MWLNSVKCPHLCGRGKKSKKGNLKSWNSRPVSLSYIKGESHGVVIIKAWVLLSTYKILSNILLSSAIPYTGDHCRSFVLILTYQVNCWSYNVLSSNKKIENGVSNKSLWFSTMVILCNVMIWFGMHTKLMNLIKYVYMTPTLIYGYANLCLICFILKMV